MELNQTIVLNFTSLSKYRIGKFIEEKENQIDNTITVKFNPIDVSRIKSDSALEKDVRYHKIINSIVEINIKKSAYIHFNKGSFSGERTLIVLTDGEFNGQIMSLDLLNRHTQERERLNDEIKLLKDTIEKLRQEMTNNDTIDEILQKRLNQAVDLGRGVNDVKNNFRPQLPQKQLENREGEE